MACIYWVERIGTGRLGLMARPRGGDWLQDEVRDLASQGVDIVVSALAELEAEELELASERELCGSCGVEFWSFPILDRSVPTLASGKEAITRIANALREDKAVAVHCRMGIGRSGMLCAGVLVLDEVHPNEALRIVSEARGTEVPDTDAQRTWLHDLRRSVRKESE